MERKALGIALAAAIAATTLAACDQSTKDQLSHAGDRIKPTMQKAGDEIERAAHNVKPTLEKAGDKIKEATGSDAAITTSIKTDYLKDPDLSVFKIDVDTRDGVVTLNGVAKDGPAKARAEKLAGAIKGVKEVRNNLTVKQG